MIAYGIEALNGGGYEVWENVNNTGWISVAETKTEDEAKKVIEERKNLKRYYLIGLVHKYGKSYYNAVHHSIGARTLATRYETEQEANDATCNLQNYHRFSYRGFYGNTFVEGVVDGE
jgi:uncharacterized alpha/beta hydrolase family protein